MIKIIVEDFFEAVKGILFMILFWGSFLYFFFGLKILIDDKFIQVNFLVRIILNIFFVSFYFLMPLVLAVYIYAKDLKVRYLISKIGK